jgi:adenylate cyclase
MAEARVDRRLAAILAADVAGYSRLMGVDEVGTLEALKAHRSELIDLKIAEHHGRIVKTTGDVRHSAERTYVVGSSGPTGARIFGGMQ